MDVQAVDERDSRWEIEFPRYRIYFFDNPNGPGSSWTAYTYGVTGAHSVHQAIAWADANARGRIWCLYAEVPLASEDGVGLLALAGSDPNSPQGRRAEPSPDLTAEAEQGG